MSWKKVKRIFGLAWMIAGVSFLAWMVVSMNAQGVEERVFSDDSLVQVERTDDFISFTPTGSYQKIVIFYPGALVDPDAYAPLCRKIAAYGYQVLLIHMPWRLAMKGYNKIKQMNLLDNPSKHYILAGHSQGGKMAAQFVHENPDAIGRLILLGTTHPRDIDLSYSQIPVLKLYGSHDGVAPPEKVMANKSKLSSSTRYVRINGGNHSQFGYYGFQFGDNKAGINREKQQKIILEQMLAFIQ